MASEEGVEEDEKDDNEHVDLSCIKKGNDKQQLVAETKEDVTLAAGRELASRNERGFRWEDGLIISRQTDLFHGSIDRIVLPKTRRQLVMETAHEKAGHLDYRKVKKIIKRRFAWPLLGRDVRKHCMSCELCQRANKVGQRKVPMIECPIITELFEKILLDPYLRVKEVPNTN